ncbi:MAG: hypothetical protein IPN20_16640 [Haliscomenobacter sp.]|nr:hypothetical protein [Haliscomenobacter sp.]
MEKNRTKYPIKKKENGNGAVSTDRFRPWLAKNCFFSTLSKKETKTSYRWQRLEF